MSSEYIVGDNPPISLNPPLGGEDVYCPLVWSYEPSSDGDTIDGRDMSGTYGTTYLAAPYNASGKSLAVDGAISNPDNCETCWNGGTWEMSQSGRKISVTVKDYEINPNWFPTKNVAQDGQEYKENKNMGCFSAGELFVVVPYGEGSNYLVDQHGSGTVNLQLTASDFAATSKSGTAVSVQANNADDTAAKGVGLTTPGTYVNRIYYANSNIPNIGFHEDCDQEGNGDCYRNGKDESAIGNGIAIVWGGISYAQSAEENRVEAGDFLMKFDDEALEIDTTKNIVTYEYLTGNHSYYYAVKPDGGSWTDDEEMEDTGIDDLEYYPTLAEAKAHGVCVGILWSFRCDHSEVIHKDYWNYQLNNQDMISKAYFKIKNDSDLIGKVYQIVPEANIWRARTLDDGSGVIDTSAVPNPYEIQNGETQVPPTIANAKEDYEKSYYDSNGWAGGHTQGPNGWEIGDSLHLTGYLARINKYILQKDSSDQMKSFYNLDAGQNIVDYELAPYINLPDGVTWENKTTMTIVDTLPVGVKYVADSAVRGATYTPGTDGAGGTFVGGTAIDPVLGTTMVDGVEHDTLTWTIPNVSVEYEQPSIYFKVRILSDVKNEQNFTNTVTVSTIEDTRAHTEQNGNLDKVGFSVIKLSNMSITKRAEKSRADINDTLEYEIIWSNNSDNVADDEILMDILPADGKGNSVFDGSYTIGELSITSSDPDYKVYYTLDPNVFGTKANQYNFDEIKAGNSNGIEWKEATVTADKADFGADNGNVTAWAVLASIPKADKLTARNTLVTTNNKPGNVYYNRALLDEITVSAPITVVGRKLSGTTWVDIDRDGVREDGEDLLPGVKVTLYDASDNVVEDLYGTPCVMETDADGNYRFENLPPGKFKVVFTDGDVSLGDYSLTVPNADGVSEDVNSDAEYDGQDPKITGIDMPKDEEITDSPYEILYQDAGFYLVEKIAVSGTKTWEDENDKDGKRPDSISIHLYADGVKIESKTVTAEDNWSWIFTDLPKEKYGVEIKYTIKEDGVKGYTATYDGYNVTNTYDPEEPNEPDEPDEPEEPDDPKDPDKPEQPGTPTPPTTPTPPATPNVPKTGDDAPLGLWMLLMLLGAAGMVTAGIFLTKSKKKES